MPILGELAGEKSVYDNILAGTINKVARAWNMMKTELDLNWQEVMCEPLEVDLHFACVLTVDGCEEQPSLFMFKTRYKSNN
jgi:hypothetical protein